MAISTSSIISSINFIPKDSIETFPPTDNIKISITEFILEKGCTETILPPLLIKNNSNVRLEFLLSTSMFPRYTRPIKDSQIVEVKKIIVGGTRYEG